MSVVLIKNDDDDDDTTGTTTAVVLLLLFCVCVTESLGVVSEHADCSEPDSHQQHKATDRQHEATESCDVIPSDVAV